VGSPFKQHSTVLTPLEMILGFAGKISSGKSTITSRLAETLRWKRASCGDHVRKVAAARGIPDTRHNLQELGQNLMSSDVMLFCNSVLKEANWNQGDSIIIDGIRHKEAVETFRSLGSPSRFGLVFLDLNNSELEIRRAKNLSRVPDHEADKHRSEHQILDDSLKDGADLVLDGTLHINAQIDEVLGWLETQGALPNSSPRP